MARNENDTIEPSDDDYASDKNLLPRQLEIKDIVRNTILALLPAKPLTRFRSVSKEWDEWITSPFFSHQQSCFFHELSGFFCQKNEDTHNFISLKNPAYGIPAHSLNFLPDNVNIRSSSNGLLLCQGHSTNLYYICNPATKKSKELPMTNYYHTLDKSSVVLSFKASLLDFQARYQVICAVPMVDQPIIGFEVYSSETGLWSQSNAFYMGDTSFKGDGFYMNGRAYWETTEREVLAYDVMNESYEIIFLPAVISLDGVLTWMNDEICYIGISRYTGNEYSLKIYGGVDMRLRNKIYLNLEMASTDVIRDFCPYRVLPCFENGVLMILVGSLIYSYRLSDRKKEVISEDGVDSSWSIVRYLPYVNSLVSMY